jgi:hypothetical protein
MMRAEIRAGELLAESEKNKGTRGQLRGDVPVGGSAPLPPTDATPKLSDLGVTKTQSSVKQKAAKEGKDHKLASLPPPASPRSPSSA